MSSQNSNSAHTVSCGNEPLGHRLERLYSVCNDPRYIHPDPLETILPFRRIEDREIAALLASSLAYGRVNQILKSIRRVLEIMGDSPRRYLETASPEQLERDFAGFKHRFHTGEDLAQLFSVGIFLRGSDGSHRIGTFYGRTLLFFSGWRIDSSAVAETRQRM